MKIYPLDVNNCASIEPGGKLSLYIELINTSIRSLSEDVKLNIIDLNSSTKQMQTIFVGIIEDSNAITSLALDSPTVDESPFKMFESKSLTMEPVDENLSPSLVESQAIDQHPVSISKSESFGYISLLFNYNF